MERKKIEYKIITSNKGKIEEKYKYYNRPIKLTRKTWIENKLRLLFFKL